MILTGLSVTLTQESVIGAAGLIAAVIALVTYLAKIHKWFLRQKAQEKDIKAIKRENTLMVYAMQACLDGLQQLGANHTVPAAKEKLDKYINQMAHDQLD